MSEQILVLTFLNNNIVIPFHHSSPHSSPYSIPLIRDTHVKCEVIATELEEIAAGVVCQLYIVNNFFIWCTHN